MGRPTIYSEEWAEAFCDEVASGGNLVNICKRDDQPHFSTVFRWLNSREDFSEAYARAREARAEMLFEQALEITEKCPVERNAIEKAKLQLDVRKWATSKLFPRTYGDRVEHDLKGGMNFAPTILIRVDGDAKVEELPPSPDVVPER